MTAISASSVANCYVDLTMPTDMGSLSFLNGNPGLHELEHGLSKAIKCAFSTVGEGQTFYQSEFNNAAAALADAGMLRVSGVGESPEQTFSRINDFLEIVKQYGDKGWYVRVGRDVLSLGGSLLLVAMVLSKLLSPEHKNNTDFSAANHPLGNLAGDLGLVALEGSKMLLTTSLSYPTLMRHHFTDEIVKRVTTVVDLLQACLDEHSAGEPAHSRLPSTPIRRRVLQCMEKGRDISTVFTLFNTTLSAVRATLWSIETLARDTAPASSRGLLRIVQNISDIVRAICSTVGTYGRKKMFAEDLTHCKSAVSAMRHQLRFENVATILPRLQKIELLISVCSTPLLDQIAKSNQRIKAYLNAPVHSLQDVQNFLQQSGIAYAVASDGHFLHDRPPENKWGQRFVDGAYQCALTQLARLPFRFALMGQCQLSRPAEYLFKR